MRRPKEGNLFLKHKTMKLKKKQQEFIKDAHNRACNDWKKEIEDNFPNLFPKTELVVGKWYNVDRGDYNKRALVVFKGHDVKTYGFGHGGIWTDYYGSENTFRNRTYKYALATKEEVEQALIAEAKKRGFKEGNLFESVFDDDGLIREIKPFLRGNGEFNKTIEYYYDTSIKGLRVSNGLYNEDGGCSNPLIFKKGKWAEIIPEKEMTKEDIEKELGYKIKIV